MSAATATTAAESLNNITSTEAPYEDVLDADDATWVLISAFIIFTMQSGFGLLEAGSVHAKNRVNIMYKNASDVIFGGLMFWFLGYGFLFGDWPQSNSFIGVGRFAVDINNDKEMGDVFVTYVFQLSFACTATTIVSGAMAERVKLPAYIIFAFLNPAFAYAIPGHWIWDGSGWLNQRGVVDIAGSGVVHLNGGAAALVASAMLGPRKGRYDKDQQKKFSQPGNPVNIILGTFILWWGWLGFNCGSTFGVQNGLWKLAGKSAITTMNASMGGGAAGIIITLIAHKGKFGVADMCNGVLGGLVAITAPCAVVRPWESIIIGFIGGLIAVGCTRLMDKIRVDDPVGAISVHGAAGIWGLLSVGFFMDEDRVSGLNNGKVGLFHGGDASSLGIQAAAAGSIIAWSGGITLIVMVVLRFTMGIRMSPEDEEKGADATEHMVDEFNPELLMLRREQTGFFGGTMVESDHQMVEVPQHPKESQNGARLRSVHSSHGNGNAAYAVDVDDENDNSVSKTSL